MVKLFYNFKPVSSSLDQKISPTHKHAFSHRINEKVALFSKTGHQSLHAADGYPHLDIAFPRNTSYFGLANVNELSQEPSSSADPSKVQEPRTEKAPEPIQKVRENHIRVIRGEAPLQLRAISLDINRNTYGLKVDPMFLERRASSFFEAPTKKPSSWNRGQDNIWSPSPYSCNLIRYNRYVRFSSNRGQCPWWNCEEAEEGNCGHAEEFLWERHLGDNSRISNVANRTKGSFESSNSNDANFIVDHAAPFLSPSRPRRFGKLKDFAKRMKMERVGNWLKGRAAKGS